MRIPRGSIIVALMRDPEACMWMTWRQLRDRLNHLDEHDLDVPVQLMLPDPNGDRPTELQGVYEMGRLGYYCSSSDKEEVQKTRGVLDNQHHPEHYVLLGDNCPFDEDGNTLFTLDPESGKFIGNKTGKAYD